MRFGFISLLAAASLCIGYSANAAGPAAQGSAGARALFPKDCVHEAYKPRGITIACADGNLRMSGMRWSKWGRSSALGTGTAHLNDCMPSCVNGHFRSYRARIRLTKPYFCAKDAARQFSRLSISYIGRKPMGPRSYSVPFPCAPL